ncbi:hypothetical protein HWV62_43319 [Athelia sp. TMB]|nr:hypothetical protein HWV62_43319 [Athelia sp. TMB]
MASEQAHQDILFERAEIHKSCKSFETVINTLNDYCEAAGCALVLQKKLAKALRETAGLKVTGTIAANALIASANIFDVMADIDAKFSKIADKECDAISSEVKKWFKKLARCLSIISTDVVDNKKEEKAHDEKISNANTRIKQAGQTYERKTKRNARDVSDEHARYINLISTLGPEISAEKYNHALSVSKKHTVANHGVAACLSRIADAEWTRSCEHVRRFSPVVGQLSEWRMYCEGGWDGPVPRDLPDLGAPVDSRDFEAVTPEFQPQRPIAFAAEARDRNDSLENLALRMPTKPTAEPFISRKPSFTASSSGHSPNPPPTTLEPPRPAFASNEKWADTVGSVTSLSSFPSPPSYVPTPPEQEASETTQPLPLLAQPYQQVSPSSSQQASASSSRLPPLSESPQPMQPERLPDENAVLRGESRSPASPMAAAVSQETIQATTGHGGSSNDLRSPSRVPVRHQEESPATVGHGESADRSTQSIDNGVSQRALPQMDPRASPTRTRRPSLDAFKGPSGDSGQDSPINNKQRGDYFATEFGLSRPARLAQPANESQSPKRMERNASTTSSGSVVAAIRSKYISQVSAYVTPSQDEGSNGTVE